MNINLKFWQSAGNLAAFKTFIAKWWDYCQTVLELPIQQYDAETVNFFILNLLAYEKGIERFDGETEELYRKRVKYADQNMFDAGTSIGMKNIFARLDLGEVSIEERIDGRDWDVIGLTITDQQMSEFQDVIETLIKSYGRTCRRYEITTLTSNVLTLRCQTFGNEDENITTKAEIDFSNFDPVVRDEFTFSDFAVSTVVEEFTFSDFVVNSILETFEYSDFEVA